MTFGLVFGLFLSFDWSFGLWVDFCLFGRFLVYVWLLGRVLAFGSIFGRVFAFDSSFGFGVDFWLLSRFFVYF